MKQSLFTRQNLKEYFIYGFIAAVAYMIPVIWFFYKHEYEDLFYLYLGTALFMAVICFYQVKLLTKPYNIQRAVAMLIAGSTVVLIGVILSCLFIIFSSFIFMGNIFVEAPAGSIIGGAPGAMEIHRPAGLLLRMLAVTILCNTIAGFFVSVVIANTGKRNQSGNERVDIEPTAGK